MVIYLFIYLLVFGISLIVGMRDKKIDTIMLVIIVLILSIFGGIRDYNIGTDINVYGLKWFDEVDEFESFMEYINYRESDIGYLLINYIVSRFTTNFSVFLFVLQIISNSLIIVTLFRFKEKASFSIMLTMYYFIFYFRSYNLLRQSIALAIIFYGCYYLMKGDKKAYLISVIIAYFFHSTAIIGLIPLIIDLILESKMRYKNSIVIAMFLLTILVMFNIKTFFSLCYSLGIISDRMYDTYMVKYLMEEINFNVSLTLIDFCFFIISFFYSCIILKRKHEKKDKFLFAMSGVEILTSQLGSLIKFADRGSFYFGYLKVFFIPYIIKKISANKNTEWLLYLVIICLSLLYWYNAYVIQGYGEIIPYKTV